jgi:hypothetical protein
MPLTEDYTQGVRHIMEMECFVCGALKDTNVREMYTAGEELCQDKPIPPLLVLECEPPHGDPVGWRAGVVCHKCYHVIDPDMWIDKPIWESLKPQIPFNQLPTMVDGPSEFKWNPESYAGTPVPHADP